MSQQHAQQLIEWIRSEDRMMAALQLARRLELPQWCIAAGAIRNLAWDRIHGFDYCPAEVDLIYWDDADISAERDQMLEAQLSEWMPQLTWDVTNQAGVHSWYRDETGAQIALFSSCLAGMASWPETATAIGVSLDRHEHLQLWAPPLFDGESGLADLLALRLRHNASQVPYSVFAQRVREKQFLQRWPKLTLMTA